MKIKFRIFFTLLFIHICFYSNGSIDSMEIALGYEKLSLLELHEITDTFSDKSDTLYYYISSVFYERAKQTGEKYYEIKSLYNEGTFYLLNNDYANALSCMMESQILAEEHDDKELLGDVFQTLGQIYYEIGNIEECMIYYNKALKIFTDVNVPDKVISAQNNIGVVFLYNGEHEKAIQHFKDIIQYNDSIPYKNDMTSIYNNIGYAYSNSENLTEALRYFYTALSLAEENDEEKTRNRIKINIGRILYKMGVFREGKKYLDEAMEGARRIGDLNTVQLCYYYFHSYYFVQDDFENALEFYKKYTYLNDSLYKDESTQLISKFKAIYEKEMKRQELKLQQVVLEAKNIELNKIRQRNNFLIITLVLTLTLVLLAYLLLSIRIKRRREKVENSRELMSAELENTRLAEQNLKEKLDYKNIELKNLALHIIEKNTFLEMLLLEMKQMNDQQESKCYKKTKALIDSNISNDKQKKEFETYIESVHQDIIFKLDKHYPGLTKNEKRLAILLMLGLSSKEIATLFNITARSVDMNRYRLRKKMQVPTEQNFSEFLNNLS